MTENRQENIYSVGQVNTYIKNMFAQDFMMKRIRVSGEVSNCKYHSSGHIYFTLKDKDGVLSAVMFAGERKKGLTFPMKEGDHVVASGAIRVYEKNGSYQLYAEEILPQGTGSLYQKFEELKNRLEEMGMFAEEYKQPIPRYASAVGVVTAPTGAAVRDIQTVAHRRNPFVQLVLYPAQVQGDGAAETIVNGIHALAARGVDVIIIGRGGGSIEDLWAFNEEIVARAIFDCPVPIISAVGHETDVTIADYVADRRAPTPSAAAELAVFDVVQTLQQMDAIRDKLLNRIKARLDLSEARVRQYRAEFLARSPQVRLTENRHRAADLAAHLQSRMEETVRGERHRLQLAAATLEAASPLKKLESGYAYVTKMDGARVRRTTDVSVGDQVRSYLADGSFTGVVDEIRTEKPVKSAGEQAEESRHEKGGK